MVTSKLATATRRPPARPVPGATWQARVLDAAAITLELNRLWARAGVPLRRLSEETAPLDEDGTHPIGVEARASTLNLTVVARSRADAERVEDAVTRLSELYPSRATILFADPARGPETEPGLDVRVALLEQSGGKGRPAVRFECVTVEVGAENERQLASIASPLLVVDLPDFLWWVGDATGGELFDDLVAITDRLIVDSATATDPIAALGNLAALIEREEGCPKLSDFAWARLDPWRQLVCQFFDPPAMRAAIDGLDEVTIVYGSRRADGRSGLTAALLFAGWLASRLGWKAPGELVLARGEPSAWRATLRAGERGRRREVLLTLRPSDGPLAGPCLAEVSLAAHGATGGAFRVERVDEVGLTTTSEPAGLPTVSRMVYAADPDDAALLTEELRVFGRDAVYEAALAVAAALAPADVPPGGAA